MKRNPTIATLALASLAFAGNAFACEDKDSSAAVKEPLLAPTTVAATKKPTAVASDKGSRDVQSATAAAKKPVAVKKPIVVAGGHQ